MSELADEQLISDYLHGDKKALAVLISRYLKPIYGFIYRHIGSAVEAEDITQEVFVRVWRHIKKFNRQKSFRAWIYRIARNASIDFLRKSRLVSGERKSILFSELENAEGENPLVDNLADPAPLPDEIFARADLADLLNQTLERLPAPYRLVLFLYYNEHLNFREIAELNDEPIDTVKSRHRRALIALRKIMTDSL